MARRFEAELEHEVCLSEVYHTVAIVLDPPTVLESNWVVEGAEYNGNWVI